MHRGFHPPELTPKCFYLLHELPPSPGILLSLVICFTHMNTQTQTHAYTGAATAELNKKGDVYRHKCGTHTTLPYSLARYSKYRPLHSICNTNQLPAETG